ncbi:hypothetical protein [Clostridium magnum]|uniref:Uncharacterized protein n=1 Tax=Clostridium magnum DSM 2767 TaxID=1121326 RepID=A0A162SG31_9CLOT|nr:hypothetical protein [Clostridium magnum]KZL91203.1 hypothetical protein CLMAG_29610 [Clostridium magnum DSM 2767]SHI17363.1 hypothetical protein SAMN02745944_02905 [Clostridium magnum DSM 2767]
MNKTIKVKIYGVKKQLISSGCGCGSGNKKNSCCNSSKGEKKGCCSGEVGCNNKGNKCCANNEINMSKTIGDAYKELREYIKSSDVKNNTELKFIDIDTINSQDDEFLRIKELISSGFEAPITVVDDIIRYYGGISNIYIYKDIKELIE